ncbi:acyl-CoA/acyl-ACP dehydrogenase [Nocardioides sp. TRM66260-LWL]|uniref:acyl-CoA dehydrogenase family protein n=1 Tax=Nocardioides sp. TRM66260-LWL TaxID=2874478 RepID=UPI001CC64974|nr:acyl-CoA dehydrogenase family protein [Nocardioides sp. TRM66260-LWL]MBZ5736265.1 acyl-CoA/acyl-ACP dehydrogenase [Nocardioides sp. TRM66260-LWL]
MDFALSAEQEQLVATVRALLARRSDPAAVRSALALPLGYDEDLWRLLCEQVGVAALAVPEEHDGAGATLFEALLVLEELGRTLTPSPLLSTLLATEVVLAGGTPEAQADLLPRLAAGETACVVDLAAPHPVVDADRASLVLVLGDDGVLGVADAAACAVAWTPSMDQTLRLGTVSVPADAVRPIGRAEPARARVAAVGTAAVAALALGCATRGLDMTVAYSAQRVQFGRPIGSFQALKHRMADLLVRVELARSTSWAGSFAVARGTAEDGTPFDAHVAASCCLEAAERVAAETVQLHGGIAITWEHDAQLVFKRAHALGHLFGTGRAHREALAESTA